MNNRPQKSIYFITGASGVGKTTLVSQLEVKYKELPWVFLHFDSVGVPSALEMKMKFGSGAEWQRTIAWKWIDEIVHQYDNQKVFIEGQVNLEFIQSGFEQHRFTDYKIILIHCDEAQMLYRLTHKRGQPELFDQHMRNWLKFLKVQAERLGASIIDTSNFSEQQVLIKFEQVIGLDASRMHDL